MKDLPVPAPALAFEEQARGDALAKRITKLREAEPERWSIGLYQLAARVLPGAENADEAGVHGADKDSGETDTIVGEVSLSSARCRTDG